MQTGMIYYLGVKSIRDAADAIDGLSFILYFPLNEWTKGANRGKMGHPALSRGEPNVSSDF